MSAQRRVGQHRAPTKRQTGQHRTPATRRTPRRTAGGLALLVGLAALSVSAERFASPAARAAPVAASISAPSTVPLAPAVVSTVVPTIAPLSPVASPTADPATLALATATDIPANALAAYQRAAASAAPSCGIQWQFIAAFGRIETDHGRLQGSSLGDDGVVRPPLVGPALDGSRTGVIGKLADASGSPVRAAGPLQFIPATWQQWGHGDVQDINQAAAAAERYLCADGHDLHTGSGRRAAALSYNHADWYATDVLAIYADYIAGDPAHTFPVAPGAG